jgi:hypothetical protein
MRSSIKVFIRLNETTLLLVERPRGLFEAALMEIFNHLENFDLNLEHEDGLITAEVIEATAMEKFIFYPDWEFSRGQPMVSPPLVSWPSEWG